MKTTRCSWTTAARSRTRTPPSWPPSIPERTASSLSAGVSTGALGGVLEIGSGLRISYVPQETAALCGTVRDYADACGIDRSLFSAILRKMGFEREQLSRRLEDGSEGQKKKILLARSLCEQAHLYIWDEPLNYMDVISRMQLEALIRESAPTMLFVEHDAAFCRAAATKTVVLP